MNYTDFKLKMLNAKDRVVFRVKETGRKVVVRTGTAVKWMIDNPEKMAGIVGGAAVMNRLVRNIHRDVTVRRAIYDKKHRIYDHSTNAYVYLKRPLRARDIEYLNAERRRTGKRVSEILTEMNLVRR